MAGSDQSPTHVRFLNVINALRQMSPLRGLTADESALLDELIVQWHYEREITVGSIMNGPKQEPASTIHRRLVAAALVSHTAEDGGDALAKFRANRFAGLLVALAMITIGASA